MAGYAAVKLGYKKLGFLGGMAVPAVVRYGYGFVQGVDAAAAELGLTDVAVKYAYGNQFYGDADITAAMDVWYGADTEVVFACGGGIFTSAGESAKKYGKKVIGVDVDQAGTIDGLAPEVAPFGPLWYNAPIALGKEGSRMGRIWMPLDNAALIFPAIRRKNWNNVFRESVTLTEDVDPQLLQRAVDELMPRFPSFYLRLRRGVFW